MAILRKQKHSTIPAMPTPPQNIEIDEAKDAHSLLSRVRDCAEEYAVKKAKLEHASKVLDMAFSKAQGNLKSAVNSVPQLVTKDLVCMEVEVEWPDDETFYRAFVCDAQNGMHLLSYVDEESGDVTTEELDLRTTNRKWRFAVPQKHNDQLVGRRCIIDATEDDDLVDRYKKTVFVLARHEGGGNISCPECKTPKGSSRKTRKTCPVHHTIIFIEDSWVTHFNFANNDYVITRTSSA